MSTKKSIIDGKENDTCFMCGDVAYHTHHLFGGPCRKASDKRGLTIRLCPDCHAYLHSSRGAKTMKYLHELGQRTYEEKIGSREQFRQEFIRSYL